MPSKAWVRMRLSHRPCQDRRSLCVWTKRYNSAEEGSCRLKEAEENGLHVFGCSRANCAGSRGEGERVGGGRAGAGERGSGGCVGGG